MCCNHIWIIVETCSYSTIALTKIEKRGDIAAMTNIWIIYFLTTCWILKGKLLIALLYRVSSLSLSLFAFISLLWRRSLQTLFEVFCVCHAFRWWLNHLFCGTNIELIFGLILAVTKNPYSNWKRNGFGTSFNIKIMIFSHFSTKQIFHLSVRVTLMDKRSS